MCGEGESTGTASQDEEGRKNVEAEVVNIVREGGLDGGRPFRPRWNHHCILDEMDDECNHSAL